MPKGVRAKSEVVASRLKGLTAQWNIALKLCTPDGDLPEERAISRIDSLDQKIKKWCKNNRRHKDLQAAAIAKETLKSEAPATPAKRTREQSPATPLKTSRTDLGLVPLQPQPRISSRGAPSSTPAACVTNPEKALRCYDVLNVARQATAKEIKGSFRKLALLTHPDKPGGDKKRFQCISEAYDVLDDPAKRQKYDDDLAFHSSQDGLSCSSVATHDEEASGRPVARGDMLLETFLSCHPNTWPKLMKMLTSDNLDALIKFIQSPDESPKAGAESGAGGGIAVPGLKRFKTGYSARLFFDNCILETWFGTLEEALDGRIALQRLKNRVAELSKNGDCSFGDAFGQACDELRVEEQAAAFYLKASYEFFANRSVRRTTPVVTDMAVLCNDRQELLTVFEQQGQEAMDAAHAKQKERTLVTRKALQKLRKKHTNKLLEDAQRRRAELGSPAKSSIAAKKTAEPRLYRIIASNKVGILTDPSCDAEVISYFDPGNAFFATESRFDPSQSRTFFKLQDGTGWVPECSRKDLSKKIVEEVGKKSGLALLNGDLGEDASKDEAKKLQPKMKLGAFSESLDKALGAEGPVGKAASKIAKAAPKAATTMPTVSALLAAGNKKPPENRASKEANSSSSSSPSSKSSSSSDS